MSCGPTICITTPTSNVVVTTTLTNTVNIVTVGPQGPPGATGPTGPAGPPGASAFVFTQSTPATTWTINHNLGYLPSVELMDSGSQEIEGEITHPSINQTIVTLAPATAGIARLV